MNPRSDRRVLLVADAGPGAGLGHLSRSSGVAVALAVRGISTICLANGVDEPVERDGIRWLPLAERDELPATGDVAAAVLDSYRIVVRKAPGVPLAVLQERTEPPPDASLVVNAGADPALGDPQRLYGPRFACLRPSFWGLPPAAPRGAVERVLVTTGAGDPGDAGLELATAVRDALPAARVRLVRGPFAPPAEVAGVEIVDSPASLLLLLLETDLVVTGGGQTMLEAAASGAPTVATVLMDNQEAQARRLERLGAVRLSSTARLAADIAALAADGPARGELARRAQSAVDGYGALRVGYAIAGLIRPE